MTKATSRTARRLTYDHQSVPDLWTRQGRVPRGHRRHGCCGAGDDRGNIEASQAGEERNRERVAGTGLTMGKRCEVVMRQVTADETRIDVGRSCRS